MEPNSTPSADTEEFREAHSFSHWELDEPPATLRERLHLGFLTARGWGLFAAGAAALFFAFLMGRRELLAISLVLLLTPLLAAFLLRFGNSALAVTRTFNPPMAVSDSSVRVRLNIAHQGRNAAAIQLSDTLPADFGKGPVLHYPSHTATHTGSESSSWYEYRLRPATRGIYPIGPLRASVGDVFGLAARPAAVDSPSALIALPQCEQLEPATLPGEHGSHGQASSNRRLTPDSFEVMTREYRPGDTVRRIHWPATARRGSLMVRQEDYRATPRAVVLIDRSRSAFLAQGVGAEPVISIPQFTAMPKDSSRRFEWALHAALGIGSHLSHTGFGIDLIDDRGAAINSVSASAAANGLEPFTGVHATTEMQQALAAVGLAEPIPEQLSEDRIEVAESLKTRLRESGDRLILILGETSMAQANTWLSIVGTTTKVTVLCVVNHAERLATVMASFRQAGWSALAVTPTMALNDIWNELGNQK
jgi:uncharacterized protein (DUF58 family)